MPTDKKFRQKLYGIVNRSDTPAGNWFDIIIIGLIVLSVIVVIIESIHVIDERYEGIFGILEWAFTILFCIEYLLRIYSAKDRIKYITSFFGIVDFLAVVPSFLGLFFVGGRQLLIVRVLRLLRIFRIFQMKHFVTEGAVVINALRASRIKIIVFLSFVLIASIFTGALMYMVESDYNPEIKNIPEGIYWAIVTLTTVGYGDSIPVTALGKILATIVMVLGYGVIAVPTGIVTAEISSRVLDSRGRRKIKCEKCRTSDHLSSSAFCHHCGSPLPD